MSQSLKLTTRPGISGTTLVFNEKRLLFIVDENQKGYELLTHPSGKVLGIFPSIHSALNGAYSVLLNLVE